MLIDTLFERHGKDGFYKDMNLWMTKKNGALSVFIQGWKDQLSFNIGPGTDLKVWQSEVRGLWLCRGIATPGTVGASVGVLRGLGVFTWSWHDPCLGHQSSRAANCRRRQATKKDETFTYVAELSCPRQHKPLVVHLRIGMVDESVRWQIVYALETADLAKHVHFQKV